MENGRLKELLAILLRESKSLLAAGDPCAMVLTDPILHSGRPMAQTFRDDGAGDSDYELWIRLLRLHCSARSVVDQGEGAVVDLREQIIELERLLSSGAHGGVDGEIGLPSATIPLD